MFSIGELSKRTGVKIPTIRYYEQMGSIDAPERSEGNQRRYTKDGLSRLSFIRHSRDLGFSIEAIKGLLELSQHPEKTRPARPIALPRQRYIHRTMEPRSLSLDLRFVPCDEYTSCSYYRIKRFFDAHDWDGCGTEWRQY